MDQRPKAKEEHPLAREVEQLEPELVTWMLERHYVMKDKQATRITEAGNKWLFGISSAADALLAKIQKEKGSCSK